MAFPFERPILRKQTSVFRRRTALAVLSGTGLLALTCCIVAGCSSASGDDPSSNAPTSSLKIVATTGHIADALRRITQGSSVEITLLCRPGIDPHSYAASTSDIQAMSDADAIYYNGFHLEAKLHDMLHDKFRDKSWGMADAFPQEARLDWAEDGKTDPDAPFDPHIWNHLPGWSKCVEGLIEQVANLQPENANAFKENGAKYVADIKAAHESAAKQFEQLPKERRVIVSAHDAFNYFAKVYDFESVAVLGIGNDAEADVATMREVAETVCDKKVPVIFIENITNPKVTEALQEACEHRKWSVKIAEEPLYSDDLGSEPPTDTFLGAFKSNVGLIAKSLK